MFSPQKPRAAVRDCRGRPFGGACIIPRNGRKINRVFRAPSFPGRPAKYILADFDPQLRLRLGFLLLLLYRVLIATESILHLIFYLMLPLLHYMPLYHRFLCLLYHLMIIHDIVQIY